MRSSTWSKPLITYDINNNSKVEQIYSNKRNEVRNL